MEDIPVEEAGDVMCMCMDKGDSRRGGCIIRMEEGVAREFMLALLWTAVAR